MLDTKARGNPTVAGSAANVARAVRDDTAEEATAVAIRRTKPPEFRAVV